MEFARTAAAAYVVIHYILKKKKKKCRWWKKKLYANRLEYGNKLLADINHECDNKNFTRTSTVDFEHLLSLVEPRIRKLDTNFRKAITAKERLLLTLRFLATGDSFSSLQYQFRISKQSISSIIPEVCEAIIEVLIEYVKVPASEEEWLAIAQEFENKWDFNHAIGAIDGKHVMIQAPLNSGTEFYNYKHFFSIVLFALVDANYNFLYVDVGYQGRISDGGIFKNTTLYNKLINNDLNIPQPEILQIPYIIEVPYVILADKAFALSENIMKPFTGPQDKGSVQRIFNYRLSRARRVVENAFGILSSVFRVLRKPILLEPEKASKIVLAAIYLHNYLRKRSNSKNIYEQLTTVDTEVEGQIIPGQWRSDEPISSLLPIRGVPVRPTNTASNIRLHLARHFSTNGSIPWQNNY